MSHRIARSFALAAASAALAVPALGAGSATANRGHGAHHGGHHHYCKGLKGRPRRECEKLFNGAHGSPNHM
jgi:hypothetical protein